MIPRALGIAAAVLLLSAPRLSGQAVLMGVVRADSTGKPLQGVEVLIERSGFRAVTDGAGRYVFSSLPAGWQMALFRSVGFRPVRQSVVLVAVDTIWANAELVPSTVELEPIVVTEEPARPRGMGVEAFEERRRLGFGKFIDSAEMRRSEHLTLADVLRRNTIIRLEKINVGSGNYGLVAASTRRAGPAGEPCFMQVILDGAVMFSSSAPTGREKTGRDPPDLMRDYGVAELQAVEVYRSVGETPIEFSGPGATCGTIVLWSRRGP